jgi:hypothetical protein
MLSSAKHQLISFLTEQQEHIQHDYQDETNS